MPGLSMSRLAMGLSAVAAIGFTPDALGAKLLALWDAEDVARLTLSGNTASAWIDRKGGVALTQAVSGARPRWDAQLFGGVYNRNGNTNVNPQNTAGMTLSGDAAATIGVVAAPALLEAAGLSAYGPNVYVLDNSLGVTPAYVFPTGNTGNTGGTNTGVAWMAGGSGGLYAPGTTLLKAFAGGAALSRQAQSFVSGGPTNVLRIGANAGQVIYFTLNGLYDGPDPGVDVAVNGAAAYGFGRPGLLFDGSDDLLGYDGAALPYPIGDAASEIWALVDQQALDSDATTRGVGGYHGGSTSNGRTLRKQQITGVNRGTMSVGDGATAAVVSSALVAFNGRHVIRGTGGGGQRGVDVDNTGLQTGSTVGATGATAVRVGALTSLNFWQGAINLFAVTAPLDANEAAQMFAFLKQRGKIA